MSTSSNCPFCKIVSKEASAHIVYEDSNSLAFLDIAPRSPGHTMVIPKDHSPTILELPEEKVEDLFRAVRRVVLYIIKALSPEGFTIGINHGRVIGQEVQHLHVHVMPRFEGDGGGAIQSVVRNSPKESLEALADKIRASASSS